MLSAPCRFRPRWTTHRPFWWRYSKLCCRWSRAPIMPQNCRPAPVNSSPRQTLKVTSESSVCMSRPRSSSARYRTVKQWWPSQPVPGPGNKRWPRGWSSACSLVTNGSSPISPRMIPYLFMLLGRLAGKPVAWKFCNSSTKASQNSSVNICMEKTSPGKCSVSTVRHTSRDAPPALATAQNSGVNHSGRSGARASKNAGCLTDGAYF
mmetsp:Transcript_86658/g.242765  ORF Transcript_86658/g.242765 Transcript_86658/m.242765 type:complete len:207 (-) Transcript_86658:655-1275(-)